LEEYNLHTSDLVNKFFKENTGAMTTIMRNAGLSLHFIDDVFNESLAEVWKLNNRGQKLTNFNTFFLFQIFKNNAINFAQKERRRETVDLSNTSHLDFGHSNLYESKVELDHMEYLLNLMEPKCREILSLFDKGYSNEEISQMMNLQKNTVATYKSTCFDKLEELISTRI
jgi:RNA polymerase sigma factor (sigma-70 family)